MSEISKKDIVFQILDWSQKEDSDIDDKYIIRLFGRTETNETIYVNVTGFKPFFYTEIPEQFYKFVKNNPVKFKIDFLTSLLNNVYDKELKELLTIADIEVIERHKFYGFTGEKLFKFLKISFPNHTSFLKYRWAFSRPLKFNGKQITFKLYESNIEPIIRCMHIQKLHACGWVSIDRCNYTFIKRRETYCDVEITTSYKSLKPLTGKENDIQKFTIASVDIECVSGDGSFPKADRDEDKIVMIATTFSRYGDDDCYYRNVIVLGDCNEIDGADVIQCKTEKKLLMEWTNMIREKNPDFITGWNIFGFDEAYIYERSKKLNVLPNVARLARLNCEASEYTSKKLASSALGDNELKYFNTTGRVHFDLMKVVQREYKLVSYKLDYVSSHFFRESITKFEIHGKDTLLYTSGTYGIKSGQYTTIVHNDGITDYEHLNGKKFKILEVTKNTILLEGNFEFESLDPFLRNSKHKVLWCQVKDDVKPKEIFSKFNGTKQDRTELALYNIQDCELCNKLVSKLQVIVDNICMANVCSVPLYYLFIRGQGVKIFSLVSKKCREKKYLIPEIKKKQVKKDDNKDSKYNKDTKSDTETEPEDESFEGAIVFNAIPGMYLNPIFVLDFASLYPNSMRYRNLSHECLVMDEKYMNLPDYNYTTIEYKNVIPNSKKKGKEKKDEMDNKNNDESNIVKCIYARKKEGYSVGIIPEILTDLLDARANTRKKIESEPDPFKKKVLDRMQLAYKITANSLYGQTGAPTSPICLKEIAACTTATGRNMLIYSKYFIEQIFGKLVHYALNNKEKYMEYAKKVLRHHPKIYKHRGNKKENTDNEYEYDDIPKFVKDFKYVPDDNKFKRVFDGCDGNEKSNIHDVPDMLCSNDIENMDDGLKMAFITAMRKKIKRLLNGFHIDPKVIYGDTDSVFVDPQIRSNGDNVLQTNIKSLEMAINLGLMSSMIICVLLPPPMKQEYEKCFYPFIQISKKRYVGNLYEKDIKKYSQKSMGIVLKRRDNAQIVKIVCGGIVDQLLNERNPKGAIQFTQNTLSKIMKGEYTIDKFIITKTLKENYKNRKSIAHAVLADRMALRDAGNKPMPNDRIPYVFVIPDVAKVKLQGDRVDTPEYVITNKKQLDYLYYITNQIMKPSLQFLDLVAKEPKRIFDKCITIETNRRKCVRPVSSYY